VAFADDFAEINRRLSCIADTLDDVVFFDAAYLFLTEDGGLNRTMLPDGLHPGEVGSRVWGQAIVDRVLKIDGGL
jgi:lysophospholipase L1-like esterase